MKLLSNFEMIKTSLKFKIPLILMFFYPEPEEFTLLNNRSRTELNY